MAFGYVAHETACGRSVSELRHAAGPDLVRGAVVEIARHSAVALSAESGDGHADPALLPTWLVRAAAAVLPAAGVGLSIHPRPELRTPVAASNEVASVVEQLQFTVGQGPCLVAASTGAPVFASETLMAQRWPAFHELLGARTPIRSVLALPLSGALRDLAVLDLCFTEPDGPGAIDSTQALAVATLVSGWLELDADWSAMTSRTPAWLNTPDRRRTQLWMAVGMASYALGVPVADGLAVLRGHAYAAGRTVDDVAADLVTGRVAPDHLLSDDDDDP